MPKHILAINPGSTSTKVALYRDHEALFSKSLVHGDVVQKFDGILNQYPMRLEAIEEFLRENGIDVRQLDAIVGRGGLLLPVRTGAYRVNRTMLDRLRDPDTQPHESNLGAILADAIAREAKVEAYIYDAVRVDELEDIARVTGMPEITRVAATHTLNSRGMCMRLAAQENKDYLDLNIIVAHMGGGVSLNVHKKGRMVEIVSDDEGPFSPQRCGAVPCRPLVNMCFSGRYTKADIQRRQKSAGGLMGYLGTDDTREVERRVLAGDEQAEKILSAMAYQIAKAIGELAAAVDGEVDHIILTGGIAYSEMFTGWIAKKVRFIAPVRVMPGECEMEALAFGVLRVLSGEEKAREYIEYQGKVLEE